jgi:hypothetical protein
MRGRRSPAVHLLILLAWVVGGTLAGAASGFAYLATQRCAGPACAGLIVVPMMTAIPGAIAGVLVGALRWSRARTVAG